LFHIYALKVKILTINSCKVFIYFTKPAAEHNTACSVSTSGSLFKGYTYEPYALLGRCVGAQPPGKSVDFIYTAAET
jgi:hypothetical protein